MANKAPQAPKARKYGRGIEVGDWVQNRQGCCGEVTAMDDTNVTWQSPQMASCLVSLSEVIITQAWHMHKVRKWLKANDPTWNDMVPDYVARARFQRLKQKR